MRKVFYKDTIPYQTPSSLSALRGPSTGGLELPLSVFWGPDRWVDLADEEDSRWAYQTVIREGTTQAQEEFLNERLLLIQWPTLILPSRCRAIWDAAFPSLAQ